MNTTQSVGYHAPRDYLHCLDCEETFDYYRYDSLADSGHNGHALRALTVAEFHDAARDCQAHRCADE